MWFGNNKKTGFYKCHAWGVLGKIIAEHAKTGTELYISGRLDQYRYDNDQGHTVYDNSITIEQFDFGRGGSPRPASGDDENGVPEGPVPGPDDTPWEQGA